MSPEILTFQSQSWVLRRRASLTVALGLSRPGDEVIGLEIEAGFVPPWVLEEEPKTWDEAGEPLDYRSLKLLVSGFLPLPVGGWLGLAGAAVEHVPMVVSEQGKIVERGRSGPEVSLFSFGPDAGGAIHDHVPQEPTTSRLVFGDWVRNADGGDEIDYELEAFYASPRAKQEIGKGLANRLADFFGAEPPHEIDEERLGEGWTLRHRGRVEFQTVQCHVPLNATDPAAYARGLATRVLGRSDWVRCEVMESPDGETRSRRLVTLVVPREGGNVETTNQSR
jgi:hypothetical protein